MKLHREVVQFDGYRELMNTVLGIDRPPFCLAFLYHHAQVLHVCIAKRAGYEGDEESQVIEQERDALQGGLHESGHAHHSDEHYKPCI